MALSKRTPPWSRPLYKNNIEKESEPPPLMATLHTRKWQHTDMPQVGLLWQDEQD